MLQEFDNLMKVVSRHLANFSQMMHLTLREITQLAETNKLNQHGSYSSFIFTRPLFKYIFIFPIPARSTQLKCRICARASKFRIGSPRCSNQENIAFLRGRLGSILDSTALCRRFGLFVLCSSL